MAHNRLNTDKVPNSKPTNILGEYMNSVYQPVKNDGLHTFITTQVEPISHIPCSDMTEIEINLTSNEVDVTQI
jgi:hypothetical protein